MDSTAADPIARFEAWMAEAAASEPNDPNAVCLATCTKEGRPSARMVLLKGVDPRGFVFYTNLDSRKGGELLANPFAALCFHWKSLQRSVRVEGPIERVSDAEADAYYASRARGSRIGAWASRQSRPLEGRFALEKAVAEYTLKFGLGEIARPRLAHRRLGQPTVAPAGGTLRAGEGGGRAHDEIRHRRDPSAGLLVRLPRAARAHRVLARHALPPA